MAPLDLQYFYSAIDKSSPHSRKAGKAQPGRHAYIEGAQHGEPWREKGLQFANGRGRGRGGDGRSRGGGERGSRSQRADYQEVPRTNALYEKYYNELGVVTEEEKGAFWAALRRDLPNSFRFAGSKGHALQVQQRLKDHYIPEITAICHNGELVDPPTALPWYPDELAWQMTTPKSIVRRFAPFSSFQKFLVSETCVGNISRQEAVSMIPPLVLDVKPGMTVLDLCAAPGSKSAQLIEMVHGGEENRMKKILRKMKIAEGCEASPDGGAMEREAEDTELEGDWADDGRATGLLVANDVDYKRAHMLIHQMKRLNSPNLIVTNHDATMFPSIKLPSEPRADGGAARGKYLKFDRILADVPCSGDGTSRKNVNVWKDWSPSNALGLFTTQVRILVRALQILKVGGRVVYSTCSMNPVENEAVVATAIDRCGGLNKVNVIDCSDRITALKRSPGLKSWIVMDKQGAIWKTWANVEEQKQKNGPDGLGRLAEGMFTPDDTCEQIPFERCMRVYGHQQDTGAFFITVLEKRSEIRARPETAPRIKRNEVPEDGDAFVEDINAPTMVVEKHESKPEKELEPVEHITVPLGSIHNITANSVEKDAVPQSDNVTIISPNGVNPLKHDLNDEPEAPPSSKRSRLDDDAQEQSSEGRTQAPLKTSAATLAYDPLRPINGVKRNNGQQFEEPFKYLDPHHPELENIYKFYKIHPQFPKDRFMVRNAMGHPAKTIYYTTALARDILNENEGKGLKFIHCGVKMFVKQDVQREDVCRWRIQTDGLPILESWVGEERVVRLNSKKTLRSLLVEMFPKVDGMGWQELGEIGERVRDIDMGCCVLRVETGTGDDSFSERIVLPLWRSLHSLNLMLPKEDRKAMLLRLYNDDSPLMDHSKDRFNVKPNQEQIGFGTEAEQQVAESVDEQNGILITTEENDAGEDIAAS